MYYISGSPPIRETSGGASFLQMLLILSSPYTKSRYLRMSFVADKTTAQFE
jgi:hypothetical protein